jgi:hypothetical protein
MFARPAAVVGFNRIVFVPAFTGTVNVFVAHAVQAPVGSNAVPEWATAPLTSTSVGRLSVAPLAYRMAMVAVPASAAVTVNCVAAPTALSPLQNPLPE